MGINRTPHPNSRSAERTGALNMNTHISRLLRHIQSTLLTPTLLAVVLSITACKSSKITELESGATQDGAETSLCPSTQTNDFVSVAKPTESTMQSVPSSAVEKSPTSVPSPPPAAPRTWNVTLEHGSQQARIDGIRIFLLEAAMLDKTSKQPKASGIDHTYTISPLVNARTNAIAPGRPLRIFIDPGHGGEDSGAVSRDKKTLESHINLTISKRLAHALQNAGFEVKLSRSDNRMTQILEERTVKAFRWKADVFISIHFNANANASAQGFETYILPPRGALSTGADNPNPASQTQSNRPENGNSNDVRNMQLGFAIHRRSIQATRLIDRGLRRARFVVLREARMPAVLVECGFLTSAPDLKFARTAEGQEKITRGIYEGICDYAFGTLTPGAPAYAISKHPPVKQAATDVSTAPETQPVQFAPPIAVEVKAPRWVPPRVEIDPNEDPRVKRIREEAAAAAGLSKAKPSAESRHPKKN